MKSTGLKMAQCQYKIWLHAGITQNAGMGTLWALNHFPFFFIFYFFQTFVQLSTVDTDTDFTAINRHIQEAGLTHLGNFQR